MAWRLLVLDGADEKKAFELPKAGLLQIGSARKHNDICLHDLTVGRLHCTVAVTEGRVVVTDLEYSTGTYVNGQKVTKTELRAGDVLRLGNSHLRMEPAEGFAPNSVGADDADSLDPAPLVPLERMGELSGKLLGHFHLGPLMGLGHHGAVFRAMDLNTKHPVAVKVLSAEFGDEVEELQRFARAVKASAMVRHTNLVSLLGAGRSMPYCWIAREYVEGESLAAVLERDSGGKLKWRFAARLAYDVAGALDALHKHHIHHGNLTPHNVILLISGKQYKLADLYFDKAVEGSVLHRMVSEQKMIAELPWQAPEKLEPGAFVDPIVADIYSVGALTYARLAGHAPFVGRAPEETIELIRMAPLERPSVHQPSMPVSFEAVVTKMLARAQEDRYQTPAQLMADLEPFVDHTAGGERNAG